MIGVIVKKEELEIVKEFFELFKTPWEFYQHNRSYDVVISTEREIWEVNSELLIVFGADNTSFDSREGISTKPEQNNSFIQYEKIEIPIYGEISSLNGPGRPFIRSRRSSRAIGLEIKNGEQKVIRVGYDLFYETEFLLTKGQPKKNAFVPTLELHILILQNMILSAGLSMVEIPPIPAGYNFITCLTHDVDFVRIRDHQFDHTMFGFLYRATLGTLLNCLRKKIPWSNLIKNSMATLMLPFVYLGFCKDFWLQFDRYTKIEKGLPSTYFFIPFKNRTGCDPQHRTSKKRAAKYDITDVKLEVTKLRNHGDEIGLHGIDAWHDQELAREEMNRISQIAKQSKIGVRMHWLCFNHNSFKILDEAGYSYDSTYGYNDAIGFRGGATQAFQPIGIKKLLEIPLHIQDSALFSSNRMNLSHTDAWKLCKKTISTASVHGGVITILWHQRSIAPERLYNDFYKKLLDYLRNDHNVWFATGTQAVQWFKKRRDFNFENIQCHGDVVRIKYSDSGTDTTPPLMVRLHKRKYTHNDTRYPMNTETYFIDVPLIGNIDEAFSLIAN